MTAIDPQAFRRALGAYPTGVTVVTAVSPTGEPIGFTANSFTSVSLEPPMLLVCPAKSLSSFAVFEQCEHFAINVLAEGQEEVANIFARYPGDRFAKVAWTSADRNLPLVDGAAASFSCRTANVFDAGDHIILLGELESFSHAGTRGLGYAAGRYFSLGLEQAAAQATPKGRVSYVGAIVQAANSVLLIEDEAGWSVPKLRVEGSAAIRTALTDWFANRGMAVTLRRTYSIFDGPRGEHFSYFLADGIDGASGSTIGRFVPLDDIASLPIASAAERAMLDRFVRETEAKSYGFYVGDSVTGYVHAMSTDA